MSTDEWEITGWLVALGLCAVDTLLLIARYGQ